MFFFSAAQRRAGAARSSRRPHRKGRTGRREPRSARFADLESTQRGCRSAIAQRKPSGRLLIAASTHPTIAPCFDHPQRVAFACLLVIIFLMLARAGSLVAG